MTAGDVIGISDTKSSAVKFQFISVIPDIDCSRKTYISNIINPLVLIIR